MSEETQANHPDFERLLLGDNSIGGTLRVLVYIVIFVVVFGTLFSVLG